jgi:hypothetical protein
VLKVKPYKFIVVFTTHQFEIVHAFLSTEAKILAQAEQIKKGNSYNVDFIKWFKDENSDDYVIIKD